MRSSALFLSLAVIGVLAVSGCATSRRARPSDGDAGRAADAGSDATAGDAGPGLDAFVALDATMSVDAFVPRDTGHDVGVDTGVDAGRDAGTDAGRDAGTDAGTDSGRDAGALSGPTFDFPGASDTSVTMLTNYWNMGDYIEGTRTTSLPTITRLMMNVTTSANGLTCDTQDMDVIVNGTRVGGFMIHSGQTVITDSFTFAAITGPTYTIRFQTTRTVTGGCGSSGFDLASSSITLAP
jgi:hypothetical protein